MDNTRIVTPFLAGKLPREKYPIAQEFAEDLAKIMAVDVAAIPFPLINLPSLKGDRGDTGRVGPRGLRGEKGDQGPQGIQGERGMAGEGFTWREEWQLTTAYNGGDLVTRGGTVYIALSNHTSSSTTAPGTGSQWGTVWDVFATKGVDGESFVWRGSWASANTYSENDVVLNGGTSYICIATNVSSSVNEPGVGANSSTYWNVMAQGSSSVTPGGPNDAVQWNNGGVLAGESNFSYDSVNNSLSIGSIQTTAPLGHSQAVFQIGDPIAVSSATPVGTTVIPIRLNGVTFYVQPVTIVP